MGVGFSCGFFVLGGGGDMLRFERGGVRIKNDKIKLMFSFMTHVHIV